MTIEGYRPDFYRNCRVLVTGGGGFLAWHLIRALLAAGAQVRAVGRRPAPRNYFSDAEYWQADLTKRDEALKAAAGMDLVFHLAAIGWGFHENLKRLPEILTENLLLNTTMLDTAYRSGCQRYLFTSSAAVYPGDIIEMEEDLALDRPPHGSEAGYAWPKRLGEIQAALYHQHYGWPVAIVRPFNPYGQADDFSPDRSHVIPGLIRRALSGESPFTVWGSGRPVRSFTHAKDVTKGMLLALERAADGRPLNLDSGQAITIAELARLVLIACDRDPEDVHFDLSKPDGHPRRVGLNHRAAALGWSDFIALETGLRETVAWYREHQD